VAKNAHGIAEAQQVVESRKYTRHRRGAAGPFFIAAEVTCLAISRGALRLVEAHVKSFSRGRQKKIDGPPRTKTKSQTHPPAIRLFFPSLFFLVRFWAFLGKGSSKTPQKYFYKKPMSHVENFSQNFDNFFLCQFFLDFFGFIAFFNRFLTWKFSHFVCDVFERHLLRNA
jgi:hypothetical protein